MNNFDSSTKYQLPTRKKLLASTAIALLTAYLILLTIVLPAEYNIDPTGFGAILGLTVISSPSPSAEAPQQESSAANNSQQSTDYRGLPFDKADELIASSTTDTFKTEIIEIPMKGDEELEYKLNMEKGQVIMYSWDSAGTDIYYEFHAEPTEGDYPEGYYMSYKIGDAEKAGYGTLVAPFTGKHGWYLLNHSENPTTVTIKISGYYSSHKRLW